MVDHKLHKVERNLEILDSLDMQDHIANETGENDWPIYNADDDPEVLGVVGQLVENHAAQEVLRYCSQNTVRYIETPLLMNGLSGLLGQLSTRSKRL